MKKVKRQTADKKKSHEEEHSPSESQEGEKQIGQQDGKEKIEASKQRRLMAKKEEKFQKDIQRCRQLILTECIKDAIQILKDIITENIFLDKYEFKGSGNHEIWRGFYPKGPLQWFQQPKIQSQISKNPFDYLGTCFMIGLNLKKITIDDIIGILTPLTQSLPNRFQLQFCFGNAYYNKQMFVKAQQHYFRALQLSKHPKIYEYIAWIKGYWFQVDKVALQYCQKCLQIDPLNIGAYYVKALCLENPAERKFILRQILNKYPDYYRIYTSLASDQNLAQKLILIDEALCYDPQYYVAYVKKGQVLRVTNEAKAREAIATAIKISPEETFAYWVLGKLEQSKSNMREAIANFQKCLEINPFELQATRSLAHLYRLEGDNGRCLDYYEKYIILNPYDEDMFNYLGLVYDYFDRDQDAIACYKKAVELNPNFFEGYSNIGLSYQQKEMYSEALKYYKKAYEVQQNGSLCYGIAICQKELGNPVEAEKWALLSIEKGGDDDKEVYEFLGDLFRDTAGYPKSAYWYLQHVGVKRSLNTNYIESNFVIKVSKETASQILYGIIMTTEEKPNNLYIFLQIGKLLLRLGEEEKACKSYEIAMQLFENHWGRNRRNDEIKRQLGIVFGNPMEGTYYIKDRIKLKQLKEDFLLKFKEQFRMVDNPMKQQ